MGERRPIGVFDSGVGGLTVLRAIHDRMPHESTIYVGDLLQRACPGAFALVDSADTTARMVERRLDHARMRAAATAPPRNELLVTAVDERAGRVAEVLFGQTVPAVRELELWGARTLL